MLLILLTLISCGSQKIVTKNKSIPDMDNDYENKNKNENKTIIKSDNNSSNETTFTDQLIQRKKNLKPSYANWKKEVSTIIDNTVLEDQIEMSIDEYVSFTKWQSENYDEDFEINIENINRYIQFKNGRTN